MADVAELKRIAAAYPPEAALTSADDRELYFSAVQRAAWDMRFCRDRPALAIIAEAQHG